MLPELPQLEKKASTPARISNGLACQNIFHVLFIRTIPATAEALSTTTYHTDPNDTVSYNKPKLEVQADGSWSHTSYKGNQTTGIVITKIVTGKGDNPPPAPDAAPDETVNKVEIITENTKETGTSSKEEKDGDVWVYKCKRQPWPHMPNGRDDCGHWVSWWSIAFTHSNDA